MPLARPNLTLTRKCPPRNTFHWMTLRLARSPCEGRPVFLYIHGNGGSLRWRNERFRALFADGSGLMALIPLPDQNDLAM
jgi:hypothetical protein